MSSRFDGQLPWNSARIEYQVRQVVATELGKGMDEVTTATNCFREFDSVESVEIIMQCGETFNVEIPDEAAEHLATVGQIAAYVEIQRASKPR